MNRPYSHYPRHNNPTSAPGGIVVSCASGMEIGQKVLERLEELDDAVFAALEGDAEALDLSRMLWSDVAGEVAPPLVAESQAQYERQARMVWDASRSNPEQSLGRAFAALEVLGLLADEQ